MTQHLKLIGIGASRAMRNLWLLEELRISNGISFEHDPISYTDDRLRAPPYTTLNPNARIPALVHTRLGAADFVLFESLAINLYLAEAFPSALSLATPQDRALGNQWAMWALTEIELPIFDWAIHSFINPPQERDASVVAAATAKLARPFGALNSALAGREYLLGENFTVADLNTACVMYRCLKMDLAAWPHIAAWLQRCWARPAALVPRRARGEAV